MKKERRIFVIIEMVEWEIRAKGKKGQKVVPLLLNKISVGGSRVVGWCKGSLPSFDTWLRFQCKQNSGGVLHPKAAWKFVGAEMENESLEQDSFGFRLYPGTRICYIAGSGLGVALPWVPGGMGAFQF